MQDYEQERCPALVGACEWAYDRIDAIGQKGRPTRVITQCSQCDKAESKCTCQKYCCFCQSEYHVRLCVDGLYYCPDCREACDVRLADSDDH
jgi:hypothetical protein